MWRTSWQDYRGWRMSDVHERHPKVEYVDFETRQEADEKADLERQLGMTVCVALTPHIRTRSYNKDQRTITGEPVFNAGWTLHR